MDERINELRAELREDPTSRLFYQLGELLRREEAHEEAVRVLRTGLAHHPRYVAAWVALGRSLSALEHHAEAEEACVRALELDPENAVAARMIGESAAARGDHVRAVKALKLARVLAPRDPDLEDRIAEVEVRLAQRGLLETPPLRRHPSGPHPVAGAAPELPDGGLTTIPARRLELPKLELAEVGEGDPFLFTGGGDTGVWVLGDDVFAVPEPEPARALEAPDIPPEEGEPGAEPAEPVAATPPEWEIEEGPVAPGHPETAETPGRGSEDWEVDELGAELGPPPGGSQGWEVTTPVTWASAAPPAAPAMEEAEESLEPEGAEAAGAVELEAEDLDELDTVPEPEEEAADWPEVEEIPLPTLTLARLAYGQGDLRLAERTLVGVLERQPDSEEARTLLERIRGERAEAAAVPQPPPAAAVEPVASSAVAKIAALRAWADAIRLAAEQRNP